MAHATSKAGDAGGCHTEWGKPVTEGQVPNDASSPKAAATVRQLQTGSRILSSRVGRMEKYGIIFWDRTLLFSLDWLGTGNSLPASAF